MLSLRFMDIFRLGSSDRNSSRHKEEVSGTSRVLWLHRSHAGHRAKLCRLRKRTDRERTSRGASCQEEF